MSGWGTVSPGGGGGGRGEEGGASLYSLGYIDIILSGGDNMHVYYNSVVCLLRTNYFEIEKITDL